MCDVIGPIMVGYKNITEGESPGADVESVADQGGWTNPICAIRSKQQAYVINWATDSF